MKKTIYLISVLALFCTGTSNLYAVDFKVTSKENNASFGSISPVD
jgi:hypothetical protein